MSRSVYWWLCLVTIVVGICCAAVGAVRWLGPAELVQLLAPLGRAPLFVGTVGTIAVYALVQSLPGGRDPLWIMRPPNDGWTLALGGAMLCASVAGFPATPGGPNDILLSSPFVLVAAFFFIDRMRRVQRQLAPSA